jgi:CSLREA domain-containing protein
MKRYSLLLALGPTVGAILLVVALIVGFRSPAPAQAQGTIITVNTDQDEWTSSCADACSLREAIAQANSTGGTEPVTITFADDYVITLTMGSLPSITRANVHIDGDRNDDGVPDVVINGQNITQTGAAGLFIKADGALVDGLEVRNMTCSGCWGLDTWGRDGVIRNSRFVSNTTGILLTGGASGNLITNCLVAWNRDDGILVSARFLTEPTRVVTPAYGNTIANSFILSNTNKGIIIQRGAHDNIVQNNLIAGNGCYGLHLRGGYDTSTDVFAPPTGNQILGNEIRANGARCAPQAAVVNERTHQPPGDLPTLSGGYDNLFAGNVITANSGMGIYNIGASPLITGNTIANHTSYGVYNLPDFGGTYSPAQAGDDILSIPILKNNTLFGNGTYGIYSLDTAPVDRYALHTDNIITQTGLKVLQVWYGAVEVVTGTITNPVPISSGISARVVSSGTGWLVDLLAYAPAAPYSSGIWGKSGITYPNVSTWAAIREFEVTSDGALIRHLTHTVQVYLQGVYTGTVRFSWDGLTATDPISGDVLIPQWVQTGPYGRYQVAEVNFTYDADRDTIPDVVEGGSDVDSDGDGTPDYLDTDSDGDGIPDAVEGTGDVDGDGLPNYLDADSDGDGIPDAVEGTGDVDNDGTPNYLDADSDGDGIPDAVEGTRDTDNDGTPDYRDDDSDNDGVPDWMEAGCTAPPTGNATCPAADRDSDGDGTPDYRDTDDDGDGILTRDEYIAGTDYFCTDTSLDTDRDGTPNCRDNDVDGDGIPNYLDGDSDGDGTPDAQENYPSPNPPPFGHSGVPAWIDPVYRLYLPIVLRNR